MEFRTQGLVWLGVIAFVFWTTEFWKWFKPHQLHLPKSNFHSYKKTITFRLFLFCMGLIAWGFISFALMGPRMPLKYSPSSVEVNDIFIVLDVSRSMLADDFEPNRLEVAKKRMREFVSLKPTDRLGLIIFSEKAFTLLPLTTDLKLMDQMLASIEIGGLGSGTNIGDGLALAVARLVNSEAKNKVVILLTDGVNNVGNVTPIQAAEMAKSYGIKVYTIAMGTDKNAKIPVNGGFFGTQYQLIPGGSIDTKTLDQMSKLTNAKMYMAQTSKALESVLSAIEKLEKTKINVSNQVVYDELYLNYLLIGVVLLFVTDFLRKVVIREVV
ncbi:MAG: VWA domain-containing protein [Bacteriovoracaceae bacterium]